MKIDDEFMKEVGLMEMPPEEKQLFMEHAQEEVELRVGQKIGEKLSDEELSEFQGITDDMEAAKWLAEHVPDFREVVIAVYDEFRDELIAERDSILG